MELAYAFLANAAEATPDGRFNVLGGDFDGIQVARFPGSVPLIALVMRWNCFPDDFGTRHRLRIEIPEIGGTATESDLEIPVPADSATTPKVLVISHLAGAIFGQAGVYRVRVSVDGRVVHSIPMTIALAPTQG